MFDSYLDPPEPEEGPECGDCSEGFGEYSHDTEDFHVYICDCCGARILEKIEPDYIEPDVHLTPEEDEVEWTYKCQHGKEGDCAECDHLGDMAYDAARERRR